MKKMIRPWWIMLFVFWLSGSFFAFWMIRDAPRKATESKINGVNFVSPREDFDPQWMGALRRINADWISIVPYAFSPGYVPKVIFNDERQWWGETRPGTIQLIAYARQQGLKIMLKPHIWVKGDGWPGDFKLTSEADWKAWEKEYTAYLMEQAEIAEAYKVDMLCVGTELRQVVKERPQYWNSLIAEVKQTYSGKLTYASNWDNYENVKFWDQLDYIGIDAYFPVSEKETPDKASLEAGWQKVIPGLQQISQQYDKPVLFTEYGYQSKNFAAAGHWLIDESSSTVNLEAQSQSYAAFYEALWHQPWFAGGFLWKWYPDPVNSGGHSNNRFTPQNKPVEKIISQWYGQ